jgi:putative PIN family toxin of toxin-antitoxin system
MGTEKIILDTNVLVSAFCFGGGPRRVFEIVFDGEYELLISEKQLEEIRRVLAYPKLQLSESQIDRALTILTRAATIVSTKCLVSAPRIDPGDLMLLEAAKEHNASYIVTGDKELRHLHIFEGTRIMSPEAFLLGVPMKLRSKKSIRSILDEARKELESKFDR